MGDKLKNSIDTDNEQYKKEVIKKFEDGCSMWRRWCKFLDGE